MPVKKEAGNGNTPPAPKKAVNKPKNAKETPPKKAAPINRQLEALKPYQFKRGMSGNPNGRPKGALNVKTRINQLVHADGGKIKLPDGSMQQVSMLDAMIIGLMAKARGGDAYAFNVLMDRLEGKVADRVVLAGDADSPLVTEVQTDIDYEKLDSDTLKKVMAARRKNNG